MFLLWEERMESFKRVCQLGAKMLEVRKSICTNSISSCFGLLLFMPLEMSSKLAGNGRKKDL